MPVFISPGVYTTILDLSLYIPNLSTTIMGMVGMAAKGPVNEPTYVSNVLSYVTAFGSPNPNYMGPYAALQFLRYGRQMYYTRVAGASAAAASVDVLEVTTAATITSGIVGPYTIVNANNNVLRIKVNADASWLPITLTKGVRTAAQVAAEIDAAIQGGAGDHNITVAATATEAIKFTSTTLGTGSHVKFDTVANGSTANAFLGISAAGLVIDGAAATAGTTNGSAVTEPYTIVTSSNDSFIVSIDGGAPITTTLTAGARTAAQIAAEIQVNVDVAGTVEAVTVSGNLVVKITSASTGNTSSVIVTANAASATLGFDALLHRGADATAAIETSPSTGPFVIGSNNQLSLRFNGGNLRTIGFTPGVRTATQIVNEINAVVGSLGYNEGLAVVTNTGAVKISTLAKGSTATVQADSSGTGQYALNLTTSAATGVGTVGTASVTVTALTKGTHGNALTVRSTAGQLASTFKLIIQDGDAVVDVWDNLTKADPNAASYVETVINGNSTWITVSDNTGTANFPDTALVFTLAGGNDGISDISDADYIGQVTPGAKTGLQVYANSEDLDLNLIAVPGISSAAVINEMLLLCTVRGDCMALVDPPFGLTVQQVVDWHNGYGAYSDHQAFNSLYGALYWPWLQIYDAVNKQKVWVPPSGLVSGVYAYTDYTTETWFAPAGLNRGHLLQPLKLEHSPDLGERDLLYGNQNAVNPIVNFRKDGITVWGQRSLQRKPSALDRVNVVRLILYLRKVIATAVKYLVFEPNDPITWATFVNLVEPYLESVKQRRGLIDYKVICDASTNPPDAMDRNEMHGVCALKPTKAAEFIEVKFAVVNQGARFEDLTF